MDVFARELIEVTGRASETVSAWSVLPNHYHLLAQTSDILDLLKRLGRFHGRTAFEWNGADAARGRKVFCSVSERHMRSDRHWWATLNYIHHNPVHHGYVLKWSDWPWSSANAFLDSQGKEKAGKIWNEFPVRDYGVGWDAAEL